MHVWWASRLAPANQAMQHAYVANACTHAMPWHAKGILANWSAIGGGCWAARATQQHAEWLVWVAASSHHFTQLNMFYTYIYTCIYILVQDVMRTGADGWGVLVCTRFGSWWCILGVCFVYTSGGVVPLSGCYFLRKVPFCVLGCLIASWKAGALAPKHCVSIVRWLIGRTTV